MSAPDRHARAFRIGFAAMLGALATLGPFAVDTYLPAFAGMQKALGATPVEMQQTLSAYLLAFGVMFLFHGALSDSFGRKPIIVISLSVFTFASVGAALAGNVHTLILWRMVQGASTGAGIVVGRAMIRDLYHEEDAQRLMSMVTLFFGLAPVV
ncbi:MAG TPA: MFS transporter, partial [Usitatibacteraceae bacterium]|nr:MFS transporter [Usitatibacteraceae bacterium]